ncbi:MAG: hypothetical protein CVV28_02465 [Methanobacteriales archaeon HGW-Methanobacteriales-1]|jgi:hypothetical protein|nr:MAG: hypothetical protein CVV28_02465 [Methanobacteriales archaeon HGW-Methanobacteriales-1]
MENNKFVYQLENRNNPEFKELRKNKSFIRSFFRKKNICLDCHNPHLIEYEICPDCGAQTSVKYNDEVERLMRYSINELKAGLPISKKTLKRIITRGAFKHEVNHYQVGILAGYQRNNEETSNIYPIFPEDLTKLQLFGIYFWRLLYENSGGLGNFIGMTPALKDKIVVPQDKTARKYFNRSYNKFVGHHKISDKELLILSQKKDYKNDLFENIENLNEKYVRNHDFIKFKQDVLEWNLFFTKGNDVFVIPEKKSLLDIRTTDDLKKLLLVEAISKNYKIKRSANEWDVDDLLNEN